MKPANIALFKRFCRRNGINQVFAGLYKQFRFPESPEDIEEYLVKVDARDVILNAFKFPEDIKTFGPEYWLDVAVKWEKTMINASEKGFYRKKFENEGWMDNLVKRPLAKPSDHDYPRTDNPQEVDIVELSMPKEKKEPVITPRPQVTEEKAAISGFDFLDFTAKGQGRRRLNKSMVSVNLRSSSNCITFSQELSEEIWKVNLIYAHFRYLADTKTMVIVFSNDPEKGLVVRRKNESGNLTIANKALSDYMKQVFDLKEDLNYLKISSNKANSKDYLTYHITK